MSDGASRCRAFRLAYDGRPFHGFQRQPDVETVEGALFAALRALDVAFCDSAPAGYTAAGRTDAGVSAAAQTVTVRVPDWLGPRALNAELPEPVWAWAAADVPDDFHATHDAVERTYVYYLYAPSADTDDEAVRAAAALLSGEHDVHNLTPDDENTIRDIRLTVERDDVMLVVTVRASGFPRQYVRRAATLLDEVGSGVATLDDVERVLGPEPLDGSDGIAPAAPHPLLLARVRYPAVSFQDDATAVADTREQFAALHAAAVGRARVTGAIAERVSSADAGP